jgi:hypothetical protein
METPPREWGKRNEIPAGIKKARNTPKNYPCMGGESSAPFLGALIDLDTIFSLGENPFMWGCHPATHEYTPTWVGKTPWANRG